MPSEYTPSGSPVAFTVPDFGETVDGPTAFRSFADDTAAGDAVNAAAITSLSGTVTTLSNTVAGINNVAINSQAGAYTLVLADAGKLVQVTSGTAVNVTVPANSTAAIAVGAQIAILQAGSGQLTITPAAGVTINGTPGLKTRAQWSLVTLIKRATDSWVAVGDTAA